MAASLNVTPAMQTQVAELYAALVGRAPDSNGFGYWVNLMATNNLSLADVANAMYNTDAARAVYPLYLTNQQIISSFYTNVLGRTADAAGLTYWTGILNSNQNVGATVAAMINSVVAYNGTDAAALASQALFNNKVTVGTYFATVTQSNDLNLAAQAFADLAAGQTVAQVEASLAGAANVGQTFTLTTGVDNLVGTTGKDTFIADNTGSNKTLSVVDTINGGAGTDTLKVYMNATDTTPGFSAANITNVETLYLNGGNIRSLDVTSVSGLTSLVVDGAIMHDASLAAAAAAGAVTYTVAGQAITLENSVADDSAVAVIAGTEKTTIASTTDTAENITVSKYNSVKVGSGAVTATQTLDLNGANVATLNLTSTGGTNAFTLTNTGGALTTINVSGDKAVSITENLSGVKTFNASAATGNVTLDVSGGTQNASLAFTGGSGNDSIKFGAAAAGPLKTMTLDGGAGTNTLIISDATISSGTTALDAGINAAKNFQLLGLAAGVATAVDASQITSISNFDVVAAITGGNGGAEGVAGTKALAVTGEGNSHVFTVDAALTGGNGTGGATAATTGGAGADALNVAPLIDNGSNVVGITLDGVTLTGGNGGTETGAGSTGGAAGNAINASAFETVNLVSNFDAATGLLTNALTAGTAGAGGAGGAAGAGLAVGTNATVNITGAADLNAGLISGTNVTVNAASFTGKLTVATGAGNDTITGGSNVNTITLNGGVDTVNLSASAAKADVVKVASVAGQDATAAKITSITGFGDVATTGDKLDLSGVHASAVTGDASNMASGTANLFVNFTKGVATFSGSTAATATFAQELAGVYAALHANAGHAAGEVAAFVFGSDTYVAMDFNDDGAYTAGTDIVVKLAGVTDATALSTTAAAAHTIFLA